MFFIECVSVPGLIVFGAHSAALVRLGFSVKTGIARQPIDVQILQIGNRLELAQVGKQI